MINVSDYKALYAEVYVTEAGHIFGISSTHKNVDNTFVAKTTTEDVGFATLSVPLDTANGSFYVLFEGSDSTMSVYRVWLE